jgi:type IV pilus assembly protein PilO
MAKWSDLPVRTQLGAIIGGAVVVTALAYFLMFKPVMDENSQKQQSLTAVRAENDSLRPFEKKSEDLGKQIENLKQQLEIQKRIVPDEKEADQFIRLVQSTAASAGIEVRLYSAKPTAPKEFYVEAPFDLNIDGPYYSVLSFFDKLSKLERIINVGQLQIASVDNQQGAKVKKKYNYHPAETVVASCVATTYFSREAAATASAAQPAGPVPVKK